MIFRVGPFHGICFLGTSLEICRLWVLLGHFHVGLFGWELELGSFSVVNVAWTILLGYVQFGTFSVKLPFRHCRVATSAYQL